MEAIERLTKEKRPSMFRNFSSSKEDRTSRDRSSAPSLQSPSPRAKKNGHTTDEQLQAQALQLAASRHSVAHLLAPNRTSTIPEGNEAEALDESKGEIVKSVSKSSMSAIFHRSSMLFSTAFQYTSPRGPHENPLFSFAMIRYILWDVWDFTEPIRTWWDSLMLLMMVYIIFATPYLIAFNINTADISSWITILDLIVVGAFCMDILLNFRTAYLGPNNEFVRDRKLIALRYLAFWFWLDLATSLPFNFILESVQNKVQAARVMRLIRLWRIIKLFRVLKELNKVSSKHLFNWLEDTLGRFLYSLFTLGLVAMSLLHWAACSFYFAASWNDFNEDTWVYHEDLVIGGYDGYSTAVADSPYWKRYIYALYWATVTMTTVGYGDIVAYSIGEKFMAMFWILIGACMFAYLMGNITSMIARRDPASAYVQEKKAYIEKFLEKRRVPANLARNVHSYYNYAIQREYMEEELSVIQGLPDRLQTLILLHLNSSFIEKVPMFQGKTSHFVVAIVRRLKLDFVLPGDAVVWQDEISHNMFFVADGQLDVRLFTKEACREAQTLTIGKGGISGVIRRDRSVDVRLTRDRDIEGIGEAVMGVVERASQILQGGKRDVVIRSAPSVTSLDVARLPSKLLGEMGVGDVFGGLSCIYGEFLPATAVASLSCELHTLEYSDLDDVKDEFPELRGDVDSLGASCRLTSIYEEALSEAKEAQAAMERRMDEESNPVPTRPTFEEGNTRAGSNIIRTSLAAVQNFGWRRSNAVAPLPSPAEATLPISSTVSPFSSTAPPLPPPAHVAGRQSSTPKAQGDLESFTSEGSQVTLLRPGPSS